jgi:hypothetical protein
MIALLLRVKKSEATPRLPHGHRVQRVFADERTVVIARASLRERLFDRASRQTRYTPNIDAQGAVCAAM